MLPAKGAKQRFFERCSLARRGYAALSSAVAVAQEAAVPLVMR